MTKYGNEMTNSELLAYSGPDNLLCSLEKQRRYVLRIEASPRACPNCGTVHAKWEIHGITNVDDYDMSSSHGDVGTCKGCGRGLRYSVPFVGSPFLSLIPDPVELRDLVADAVKQSDGRWQAITRRLNGEVVWSGTTVHHSKRAAIVEAHAKKVEAA